MTYLQIQKLTVKKLIKMYLKSLGPNRAIRIVFLGKRLKAKQSVWLHFSPIWHDTEETPDEV